MMFLRLEIRCFNKNKKINLKLYFNLKNEIFKLFLFAVKFAEISSLKHSKNLFCEALI